MNAAKDWIEKLDLQPHPEGGYFKEIYRATENIEQSSLPLRYRGGRTFYTSIYYLLEGNNFSAFHTLKSDEIWHFYDGAPLSVHIIDTNGVYKNITLGIDIKKNQVPQFMIPAGCWFAANVETENSFTLIGCSVSPGFEYDDFELADKNDLMEKFPNHKDVILKLTR